MRVLEVLDSYYPKFDGPNLVITSYANSFLKDNDVECEVAVPRYPKYKDNQKFKVNRVRSIKGPEGYTVALPNLDCKLKKYLKEKNFDIIHIHSPFTMCKFFTKYGKKHNIPTIFTFHTKFKEDFERKLKSKCLQNFMMKYILKNINNADYVTSVSNGAAECLKEYGYKKQIDVIRNGTDLVYPENAEELIKEVNEKYNLNNQKSVFLSVGRIVENKKLQQAIKALKIVKEKGYDFKYLIVGSGTYEQKLKDLVKENNLQDNVIFTGKIMDRKFLSGIYLRADLFMLPSTFDTASLAPIEAAALKVPSLLNKGCSTAEIITDNRNGFLAEESEEAWAEKIIEIINNNDLNLVKENAYKEVYKTWDSVALEVKAYYQNILQKRG